MENRLPDVGDRIGGGLWGAGNTHDTRVRFRGLSIKHTHNTINIIDGILGQGRWAGVGSGEMSTQTRNREIVSV